MRTSRDLRAPLVPQMNDNGIIDNNDLGSGNIYVFIPPYSNMAIGDLIILDFGKLVSLTEVVSDANLGQNIEFHIPEANVPDGIYTVSYTAIDLSSNPTSSAKALAIVSRDGTRTLEKPVFIDAVNDTVSLDSVKLNQGTRIQVPPYQGIEAGDRVELNYLVYDTGDEIIPEASVSETHTVVSADLTTGYQTLIPESKIFLPDSARAVAFYRITRISDGTNALSFDANVTLNGIVEFLENPHFTDALSGWLTQYDVANGIRVHINAYSNMAVGDLITLIWRGFNTGNEAVPDADGRVEYRVSSADIAHNIIHITLSSFVAEAIDSGKIDIYYRVKSASNPYRVSHAKIAFINMSAERTLPAPTFPQASNGTIKLGDIHSDNGIVVEIAYPSIAIGDRVIVVMRGEDKQGVEVPDSNSPYELIVDNAGSQNITVSAAYADAVGAEGTLYATYMVTTTAGSQYLSTAGSALLAEGITTDFKFKGTSGSPVDDYSAVHVSPCNYGFIQAPAGDVINVSCQTGATILESNATDYTFTMDATGVQRFRVKSVVLGDVAISISNANTPTNVITGVLTFENYRLGNGIVNAIANTTNALPDGVSPCSIYLYIEEKARLTISTIRVAVPTPLWVSGHKIGETVDITLNADGSAQIDILSNTAVSAAGVIITSPQSTEVNQTVSLSFSNF
ncbi:hypothetical protein [Cedecea sp.]|uniref:hypothetical protein n=1 Tax=Cedecea sp. TaxID=1970739 RepID=UPI002F40CC4C